MTTLTVMQFDLWAADVEASRQDVAYYDGFTDPGVNRFFQGILAPNDKIYLSNASSTRHMHIIHNPEVAGVGCNVEQHGLEVPNVYGFFVPNMPNFKLFDAQGSDCDTLGIDTEVAIATTPKLSDAFSITPNPAAATAVVQWQHPLTGYLTATDLTGREVLHQPLQNTTAHTLDCRAWPQGVYVLRVVGQDGHRYISKFIIQH